MGSNRIQHNATHLCIHTCCMLWCSWQPWDAWQARSTKIICLVTWFCLLWSLIRHSWLLVMLDPWSRRSRRLVCCQNFLLAWCTWKQQATVNEFVRCISLWQNWLDAHSVTLTGCFIDCFAVIGWFGRLSDCLTRSLVAWLVACLIVLERLHVQFDGLLG